MTATAKVRGSAATTRLRKVECTTCTCIVRMSRAAMAKCGVPRCGCGSPMMPTDLDDAMAAGVGEDHPEYADIMRREMAAAIRDASKGRNGRRLQCGACHAFIPAVNHMCGCGFENAIRGHRNDGRYVSGAAYCKEAKREEAIPF